MNVETPQEIAERCRVGLRKAARLSPAEAWARMIEWGLIDEEGRVSENIGGTAKTKRPVYPKLLAR